MSMSRIGSEIKKTREAKGMSRKQLAKSIGVTEGFILDIESGKKVINDELLKKVSKVLEKEINDVMLEEIEESQEEKKIIMQKSVNAVAKTIEKKVQEVWSDALDSVLKTVPVYRYDLSKAIDARQLPVISNKVEGFSKDKVFFLLIEDNDMIGFRIMKGDVAFAYSTHEIENNSICLVEYNDKRSIRQIKKLDGGKLLLISNKGTIFAETVSEKSIKVLARLVKLEIKLQV